MRSPDAEPEAAVVAAQAVAAEPPDAGALHRACGVLVAYERLDVLAEAADAVAEAARACGRLLDLGIAPTMRAQSRFLAGALENGEEDTRTADRAAGGLDPLVRRHTRPVLRRVQAPVERARALIDLGAALRRANRRVEAHDHLTSGCRSPTTAARHLGNVYRKLAVAGRSALAEALRGEPPTRPQRR